MSSHWIGASPPNSDQVPVVKSLLKDFSAEALGELRTWLEQNPPAITIQSIVGYSQTTPQSATDVVPNETTTSLTFTDLATAGPTLTNLPDGNYLFIWGAAMTQSSSAGYMGLKINSTEATDNESAVNGAASIIPGARALVKRLSNGGNNTVTCRYRVDGGTGGWQRRWLHAIRVSN